MVNLTDCKYINENVEREWGYELSYNRNGNTHKCKILCKPLGNNRRGIYQTRTDSQLGLYSFYDARDDHEARNAIQKILDETLTELKNTD